MPKVSIVVPIYKVERYLNECVDSIISQTLKDIEIILVDDGSPDKCPQICDEYAAKDSRIKVIHKENGGYGTACNRGIAEATGDYIGLVESDDWIEPTMYEKLYNQIVKFDADVCVGSFYEYKSKSIFPNGTHDKPYMETIENIDDTKLFSIIDFPFLYTVHPSVWSKLYKSSFIKTLKFDETPKTSFQDGPFITEVYCKTNKIIGLKDFIYQYRVDNEAASSTSARKDKKLIQILDSWQIAKSILIKYNMFEQLKEEFFFQASKSGLRFYRSINKKYKKEFFKKWQEFAKEIKDDKTFTYRYFDPKRKHILASILNNDFKSSLYDEYSAIKLLGFPLLEKKVVNTTIKKCILGIPYFIERNKNGYKIKKHLLGLYQTKKNAICKKYYILGVQVFKKRNYIALNSQEKSQMDNFLYYTKLAELQHPLIFNKYKDSNLDKDVVIYACGPSAKYYSKINNVTHISVNRAFYNYDINFDVLFMHDDEFVAQNLELLKNYHADKFCAYHTSSANAKKFNTTSEKLKYIGAQRFFISNPSFKGVDNNIPDAINPDISKGMFYDRGGGTVFSALQFVLYTHPKRIYLVGCDCTSDGYFYSKQNNDEHIPSHWIDIKNGKNELLSMTKKLWQETASILTLQYPDVEVVSINPVGLKGLFKDVYTQRYIDEHPELNLDNVEILDV